MDASRSGGYVYGLQHKGGGGGGGASGPMGAPLQRYGKLYWVYQALPSVLWPHLPNLPMFLLGTRVLHLLTCLDSTCTHAHAPAHTHTLTPTQDTAHTRPRTHAS